MLIDWLYENVEGLPEFLNEQIGKYSTSSSTYEAIKNQLKEMIDPYEDEFPEPIGETDLFMLVDRFCEDKNISIFEQLQWRGIEPDIISNVFLEAAKKEYAGNIEKQNEFLVSLIPLSNSPKFKMELKDGKITFRFIEQ